VKDEDGSLEGKKVIKGHSLVSVANRYGPKQNHDKQTVVGIIEIPTRLGASVSSAGGSALNHQNAHGKKIRYTSRSGRGVES